MKRIFFIIVVLQFFYAHLIENGDSLSPYKNFIERIENKISIPLDILNISDISLSFDFFQDQLIGVLREKKHAQYLKEKIDLTSFFTLLDEVFSCWFDEKEKVVANFLLIRLTKLLHAFASSLKENNELIYSAQVAQEDQCWVVGQSSFVYLDLRYEYYFKKLKCLYVWYMSCIKEPAKHYSSAGELYEEWARYKKCFGLPCKHVREQFFL